MVRQSFDEQGTTEDDSPLSGGKPEKHLLTLSLTASDPERLEAWYNPSMA
jgi:hypothetical protein